MANMLTYYASKSTEYSWKENGLLQFPDENFAREVMQLFTVGLVQLNNDGTTSQEHLNAVYSNEDIMEYARIWTGLGNPVNVESPCLSLHLVTHTPYCKC